MIFKKLFSSKPTKEIYYSSQFIEECQDYVRAYVLQHKLDYHNVYSISSCIYHHSSIDILGYLSGIYYSSKERDNIIIKHYTHTLCILAYFEKRLKSISKPTVYELIKLMHSNKYYRDVYNIKYLTKDFKRYKGNFFNLFAYHIITTINNPDDILYSYKQWKQYTDMLVEYPILGSHIDTKENKNIVSNLLIYLGTVA